MAHQIEDASMQNGVDVFGIRVTSRGGVNLLAAGTMARINIHRAMSPSLLHVCTFETRMPRPGSIDNVARIDSDTYCACSCFSSCISINSPYKTWVEVCMCLLKSLDNNQRYRSSFCYLHHPMHIESGCCIR